MKKFGLQLRIPPQQQKKAASAATKPTLPPASLGFGADADDEDDVEREIARQAAKKRALKEVEEKHKKALEEDPSVFDYDGVYDEMKQKIARPLMQDRMERKSKYIERLMEKAKVRQMEHEIIYEKKLVKERSKEDHLYQDKEKFVTSAYRKKLEEQKKWMEEERLRQLLEEKDDVTKKSVVDFYFNLDKNVAYGAQGGGPANPTQQERTTDIAPEREESREADVSHSAARVEHGPVDVQGEVSIFPENNVKPPDNASVSVASSSSPASAVDGKPGTEQESEEQRIEKSYKRGEDAVAAARERYLARKKARGQ